LICNNENYVVCFNKWLISLQISRAYTTADMKKASWLIVAACYIPPIILSKDDTIMKKALSCVFVFLMLTLLVPVSALGSTDGYDVIYAKAGETYEFTCIKDSRIYREKSDAIFDFICYEYNITAGYEQNNLGGYVPISKGERYVVTVKQGTMVLYGDFSSDFTVRKVNNPAIASWVLTENDAYCLDVTCYNGHGYFNNNHLFFLCLEDSEWSVAVHNNGKLINEYNMTQKAGNHGFSFPKEGETYSFDVTKGKVVFFGGYEDFTNGFSESTGVVVSQYPYGEDDTGNAAADAALVAADKAVLLWSTIRVSNTVQTNVISNLSLPNTGESGSTISWQSSNIFVISNTGVVTRPDAGSGNKAVTLTATIKRGSASDTTVFVLTVIENNSKIIDVITYFTGTPGTNGLGRRVSQAAANEILDENNGYEFVEALLSTNNNDGTSNNISNSIRNLILFAQYRPNVFGSYNMDSWYPQNYDYAQKNQIYQDWAKTCLVTDDVLGEVKIRSSGGCHAYAVFCFNYIFGEKAYESAKVYKFEDEENSNRSKISTENFRTGKVTETDITNVKNFLSIANYGDLIRYRHSNNHHSIIYLGNDTNGFFFLSYSGGKSSSGKSSDHLISLEYITFAEFTRIIRISSSDTRTITISKTALSDGTTNKIYGDARCPIDISISVGSEQLNSATGQLSASFGKMTVADVADGKHIRFEIDYNEDYEFQIVGTDNGTMSLIVYYDTPDNSRTFVDVGITETTSIAVSPFVEGGPITLYVSKTVNGDEYSDIWYSYNGIANSPDNSLIYMGEVEDDTEKQFADVSSTDWFYDAVKYVYEQGIMQGTGNAIFAPNTKLNRAMLVQMLHNLENQPTSSSTAFEDVHSGAWYSDAIAWAAENSIVNGIGNNLFAPMAEITREQMAAMLYNYCTAMDIEFLVVRSSGSFTDAGSISDWAAKAVDAMYKAGILNGKGNNAFDPKGTATRAEVAQMFMNFMEAID